MAKRKYSTITPFGLRMQPELKAELDFFAHKHAAERDETPSLNKEIVERLEKSLKFREELDAFSDGELIDELIKRHGIDRIFIQIGKPQE